MSKKIIAPLAYFLPALALAQQDVLGIFEIINDIINVVIPFFITLALLFFLWGVLKYVSAGGDEEGRKAGINTMIWGIVALFVIISVWGLVAILNATFGVQAGGGPGGIPTGAGDLGGGGTTGPTTGDTTTGFGF